MACTYYVYVADLLAALSYGEEMRKKLPSNGDDEEDEEGSKKDEKS